MFRPEYFIFLTDRKDGTVVYILVSTYSLLGNRNTIEFVILILHYVTLMSSVTSYERVYSLLSFVLWDFFV